MTKKTRNNRPPKAFENAILNFVVDAGAAQCRLTKAMLGLSIRDWIAARKCLTRWIENGSADAKIYQRVIDEVDHEISRAVGERG